MHKGDDGKLTAIEVFETSLNFFTTITIILFILFFFLLYKRKIRLADDIAYEKG
jgi:predicted PurR-regulated permease PerM